MSTATDWIDVIDNIVILAPSYQHIGTHSIGFVASSADDPTQEAEVISILTVTVESGCDTPTSLWLNNGLGSLMAGESDTWNLYPDAELWVNCVTTTEF